MLIILPDKCNFNVKYFEFNELKEKFYDQKIIFIGVTTNYFETIDQNNNELPLLDSNCKINYNFDFFITKPIKVKGKESHMFFKWLKCDHNYQCFPKDDYHQILIGKDGEIFGYYPNNIPIKSAYIMDQINKSLLK
jgi:glutathione peroxidase